MTSNTPVISNWATKNPPACFPFQRYSYRDF